MRLFPPTIADEITRARDELATNASITVYDMLDGQEWNRRPVNPFLSIRNAMQKMTESAARMGEQMQDMTAALARALRNPNT